MLAAALGIAAAHYFHSQGTALHYGDAEAHLNIARRVLDSRTPNGEQFGTVWLPLPHLLLLPFAMQDSWWHSGAAAAIPSVACFALAVLFLFLAVRRLFGSAPAFTAAAVFALNPNLLFLQSTAMTEPVFFAGLFALLHGILCARDSWWGAAVASAAMLALTQTRYEGWFLIPFAAIAMLWIAGWRKALVFSAVAALGLLTWLAHNWLYWSDPLEFYRGPYSALAIYQRSRAGGMQPYPGDHDWPKALEYFAAAANLTTGWPAVILGALGLAVSPAVAFLRFRLAPVELPPPMEPSTERRPTEPPPVGGGQSKSVATRGQSPWRAILGALLLLPPAFYIWSLYSSGTPIFVPHLWPNTYYNTRYGLAVLPALAFGAAVLCAALPRGRWIAALAIPALAAYPWIAQPDPATWICWKEAAVNSEARRAWTWQAARFLETNYRMGDGIYFSFGDQAGILRQAGIPFREALHEGNKPWGDAALAAPKWFLKEKWVIAFAGDRMATALQRTKPHQYRCVRRIEVRDAPAVEIYRRD